MLQEPDAELRAWRSRRWPSSIRKAQIEEQLKILLLPKDPNDEKNVVLEIAPARRR